MYGLVQREALKPEALAFKSSLVLLWLCLGRDGYASRRVAKWAGHTKVHLKKRG